MTVAHVVDYIDKFGGMRTHVQSLSKALDSRGIRSIIIAPQSTHKTGWDMEDSSLLWVYVEKEDLDTLRQTSLLLTVLDYLHHRGNKIDIINAHSTSGYILGTNLSYALRIPVVFTMHGGWLFFYFDPCMTCTRLNYFNLCKTCDKHPDFFTSKKNKYIEYLLKGKYLTCADRIIVLNRRSYDHCRNFFAVSEEKLLQAKLWVDFPSCDRLFCEKKLANSKFRLFPDSKIILWVGTNRPHKRPDIVFKAFIYLQSHMPNVELWVVGLNNEEFLKRAAAEEIDDTILSRIHNLGILSSQDVSVAYSGADILWQPSVWESVSYVLLEAMAHLLPCIAVNDLDNTELFGKYDILELVERDDYISFAKRTMQILLNSYDNDARIYRAREYIFMNHTEDRCLDNFINCYQSTIENYKKQRLLNNV